jgi:hypothetical protein
VIGVSNNNPNGGGPQLDKLQYIAENTGGLSYYAPSLDSLASIYKAIYGHISGYYVLAHTSPDPFTNGRKRVLDLTMDYLEEIGSSRVHHVGRDTIHYKVPYIPPNVFPRLTVTTDSMTAGPNPMRLAMAGDTVVIGLPCGTWEEHAARARVAGDSLTAIGYSTDRYGAGRFHSLVHSQNRLGRFRPFRGHVEAQVEDAARRHADHGRRAGHESR